MALKKYNSYEEWRDAGNTYAGGYKGYEQARYDEGMTAISDQNGTTPSTPRISPEQKTINRSRTDEVQDVAEKQGISYQEAYENLNRTQTDITLENMEESAKQNKIQTKLLREEKLRKQKELRQQESLSRAAQAMGDTSMTARTTELLGAETAQIFNEARTQSMSAIDEKQRQLDRLVEENKRSTSAALRTEIVEARAELINAKNASDKIAMEQEEKLKTSETELKATQQKELETLVDNPAFQALSREQQDEFMTRYGSLDGATKRLLAEGAKMSQSEDKDKMRMENTTKAMTFLDDAAMRNMDLTSESLKTLTANSYISEDQAASFMVKYKGIWDDKNLDSEQRNIALQELTGEYEAVAEDKISKEKENFEYYKALLQSNPTLAKQFAYSEGYTPEEIANASSEISGTVPTREGTHGITSFQDGDEFVVDIPEGYSETISRVTEQTGKQCGEFVKDVTGMGMPNGKKEKEGMINITDVNEVNPGDVFVESIGDYGHVGIISKVYEQNGKLVADTVEYNRKTDQKESSRTAVPMSSFTGFVNNDNRTEMPAYLSDTFKTPKIFADAVTMLNPTMSGRQKIIDKYGEEGDWETVSLLQDIQAGDYTQVLPPEQGKYAEAMNTLGMSLPAANQKAMQQQAFSISKRMMENPKDLSAINRAQDKIDSNMIKYDKDWADRKTFLKKMNIMGTLYRDYDKAHGGTGRVTKSWDSVKKWAVNNKGPELARLEQSMGMNLASYIKQISGVAVSEPERKFLSQFFPGSWNPNDVNIELMNGLYDNTMAEVNTQLNTATGLTELSEILSAEEQAMYLQSKGKRTPQDILKGIMDSTFGWMEQKELMSDPEKLAQSYADTEADTLLNNYFE